MTEEMILEALQIFQLQSEVDFLCWRAEHDKRGVIQFTKWRKVKAQFN